MRVCLVVLFALLTAAETGHAQQRDERARLLQQSSSWSYQLQSAEVPRLSQTHYDVLVIDAFFGGGRREVEQLRRKPGGSRRIVLAYLSIGEAEEYRYYWRQCCAGGRKPAWLATENDRWRGNHRVLFWHPEWKRTIYDSDGSYLARIAELGFDGVYLDRVDVHAEVSGPGIDARAEMVRFVRELSARAKSLQPGFVVIAQNAEELADDDGYLATIDGIAKEDLLYGVSGEGKRNESGMVRDSIRLLSRAKQRGKHIMVVEYLQAADTIERARTEIMELGFVPYFAPRQLESLQVENLEHEGSH